MKKGLTKVCALSMAAAMIATGCGSTATTETTAAAAKAETTAAAKTETTAAATEAAKEAPQEIVDITVMVYDRGREYVNGNTVTENEYTRWVNEQMEPLGVHVTYVPVPRSGADDKVNLMLTGGTAPDVIRTYDRQRVATYGSLGGLVDLAPYYDQMHPDYKAKADLVKQWHEFDGALYSMPGIQSYYGKGHETFLRKDLVEGMGMEMPTNREELIEVLYAMKENYPDITPYAFGGSITDGKYTNWILSYCSRANERDNYIYEPTFTTVLKPGHKDGLRQLNQFVLDGIIDPNFALDVDDAKFDEAIANGKVGFVMDGGSECIWDAYETSGNPDYYMVEGDWLENADGDYIVPSQDAFSHYVYVPATAADRIDAVVKYLAFMSDPENAKELKLGIEGLGYEVVDGRPVAFDRSTRLANGTSGDPGDNNFLYTNFDWEYESIVDGWKLSDPEVPVEVIEGKFESQYNHYYDKMLIPAALASAEYVPLLQELIVKFVFKCMTAPEGQFDAVYEKEYQVLVDNHLNDVLEERAAWYDANH